MLGAVLEFFDKGAEFVRLGSDSLRDFFPVHARKLVAPGI
jgi:hypothetical protein